jgi:hypothetical protein
MAWDCNMQLCLVNSYSVLVFIMEAKCDLCEVWPESFLGAFVKLWKAIISFVVFAFMSVRLSINSSAWKKKSDHTDLVLINIFTWIFFENLSKKPDFIKIYQRIKATLHEDENTFFIVSHTILLAMRNTMFGQEMQINLLKPTGHVMHQQV